MRNSKTKRRMKNGLLHNTLWHFITITRHKWIVMGLCFRVGLVKQGILHDLSKYSPEEFMNGIKYFQGYRSPNAAEKLDKGYSLAWLHHKGRNKHHFEYWIDYTIHPEEGLVGMKMPLRYVLEMTCDRIGASKIYGGKEYRDDHAWQYYHLRERNILLHPQTRALLERLLKMNRDRGEKKTIAYMRWLLDHPQVYDEIKGIELPLSQLKMTQPPRD